MKVTKAELARTIGVSRAYIGKVAKEGRVIFDAEGKTDLETAVKILRNKSVDKVRTNQGKKRKPEKAKKPPVNKLKQNPKGNALDENKVAPEPTKTARKHPETIKKSAKHKPIPPTLIDDSDDRDDSEKYTTSGENEYTIYNKARAQKTLHEARIKELEFRQKAGELVDIEAVRADATEAAAEIRAKLFSIPSRLAVLLEGKKSQEIEYILMIEINDALDALNRTKFNEQ